MSALYNPVEQRDLDDLICVFGSNRAGRHGKGAAYWAARFRGAQHGVGSGRTGQSYAIPTKDEHIRALSLMEIRSSLWKFVEEANATPNLGYQMTKIGCGLAGIPERKMQTLVTEACLPDNVQLPGTWAWMRDPGILRLMVSVDHIHRDDHQIRTDLDEIWERATQKGRLLEIITAATAPMDRAVIDWAGEQGVHVTIVPMHYQKYAHAAETVRDTLMTWYATHLLAYPLGEARTIYQIIRLARGMGLATVVRDLGTRLSSEFDSVHRRIQDIEI